LAIVVAGYWLLRPPAGETEESGSDLAVPRSARKYTIRVAPGVYLPGRRMNPGDPPQKALREVADRFEKLYPDTKIEFLDAPLGQREWLVTQLAAAQAPEVVNVNVEDVWQDVQKGWYVPLDEYLEKPNPFVKPGQPGSREWWDMFKYQAITRGKAAPDGLSYCLTLDMIETGIFYNKDIFRKVGVAPPKDWEDFLRVQQKIQDAGITPMLADVGSLADWGVDLTFDQLYREIRPTMNLRGDPKRDAYLEAYLDWDELSFLNKKGFFTKDDPRFIEVFRILKDWRRFMPKDIGATDTQREFLQGNAAMFWSSSFTVHTLVHDPHRTFDWGVFYLPPITKATSRYASGVQQCVIGGAATQLEITNSSYSDTGDPRTSEKLKRTVAFLQYMCLPENCKSIVNEIMALLPNIVGVDPHPELMPFHQILQRDYTTTKWMFTFDLRFSEIIQRMLFLYLVDGISEAEFMDWMYKNVAISTDTIMRRKNLDLSPLEKRWRELAPIRETMKDLPPLAKDVGAPN
jgi:maltose-binding protein MalE